MKNNINDIGIVGRAAAVAIVVIAVSLIGTGCASVHYDYEVANGEATITKIEVADADVTEVEIPDAMGGSEQVPVVNIKSDALADFKNVSCVRFPATLRSVPPSFAFSASSLREVVFKEGSQVETIGAAAFYMSGIESVTLPVTVKTIDTGAFAHCKSLRSVKSNAGLKTIGRSAFEGDVALSEVVIPDGVTEIGDFAFYGNSGLMRVPASVKKLGHNCFGEKLKIEITSEK